MPRAGRSVVEVDPKGPVASKLQVGDKIVAVDGELLTFRKFIDVVGPSKQIKLRIARLRAANVPASGTKSKKEQLFGQSKKAKKKAAAAAAAAAEQASAASSACELVRTARTPPRRKREHSHRRRSRARSRR